MAVVEKKLLLIDEDPSIIQLVETLLADTTYKLYSTTDKFEAVVLARDKSPNTILLDMTLAEVQDNSLLGLLRDGDGNSIPILIMTDSQTLYERTMRSRRPEDGYINKPFSREELLDAIETQHKWIDLMKQKPEA